MKNTKLINLLCSLSRENFKKLGDFVSSPYFNKLKDLIALYNVLKKYYPIFDGCTKEKIFFEIYPEQDYNDERLRVTFSRLLTLTEKFLAVNAYYMNELQNKIDIIYALPANNEKLIKKNFDQTEKLITDHTPKDESYYHLKYRITAIKNLMSGHYSSDVNYQAEADELTVYYLVSLLKIYTTAVNTSGSVNISIDTKEFDELLYVAEKEKFRDIHILQIHYNLYKLAKENDNEKYFFKHLELTKKYPDVLSRSELYESYILLLNFCVMKVQNGHHEFTAHKFEIYRLILENGLINKDGFFPYELFNNIINSALETHNSGWALEFIENNKNRLHPDVRKDITGLGYARIKYYTGSYHDALEHINLLNNIKNPGFKLAIKDLSIKIFYELGYYENIISVSDSYRHLLAANKLINKEIIKKRNDFLNHLNRFIKIKFENDINKLKEFHETLLSSSSFPNKEWLLEKSEVTS